MNSYRILGPTTIHLHQEVYLFISLLLLTVSSLQGIYKDSLGLTGDYLFLLLVGFWLARYPIIRWVCTSETSTSRSPTVGGVTAHWLTSHFMAGQYFDRPSAEVVAKQLGTQPPDDERNGATLSSFFLPSFMVTWQFLKVWILFPAIRAREFVDRRRHINPKINKGHNRKKGNRNNNTSYNRRSLKINKAFSHWSKFRNHYGPPLQMIIPATTLAFYAWVLTFAGTDEEESHVLTMNTGTDIQSQLQDNVDNPLDFGPYGAYQKMKKPSWYEVLYLMSAFGTLASIAIYGRLILPIFDLVAGGNVLKALRNDPKTHGNHGNHGSSGKSKFKVQRDSLDLPWIEQYRSIVGENRFRLITKSASLRCAENLLICAFMPRTGFSCRFTGQCPEGYSLRELSRIFHPVGIASILKTDVRFQNQFNLISADQYCIIITVISVILITGSAITTQAATLDRSYLSTMGHLVGGWTIIDENNPIFDGVKASPWDPRRRYKKGDLISQSFPGFEEQTLYIATTNQPEGRPFDLSHRAAHDLFRNECGHPATSGLISFLVTMHLAFIMGLIVLISVCHFSNFYYESLIWTLAANVVSAYGIIRATANDLSEVETIAKEISR